VLAFKGRRRAPLMQPGHYTELFFLDDATACAAGHRPCHECRRTETQEFHAAWCERHPGDRRLPDLDRRLHAERTGDQPRSALGGDLPDGAAVDRGCAAAEPFRFLLGAGKAVCGMSAFSKE
jgi:hypothetical protein